MGAFHMIPAKRSLRIVKDGVARRNYFHVCANDIAPLQHCKVTSVLRNDRCKSYGAPQLIGRLLSAFTVASPTYDFASYNINSYDDFLRHLPPNWESASIDNPVQGTPEQRAYLLHVLDRTEQVMAAIRAEREMVSSQRVCISEDAKSLTPSPRHLHRQVQVLQPLGYLHLRRVCKTSRSAKRK